MKKEIRHQNWSAIMEVMIPVIRFVSRLRGDKIQKKLSGRKLYLKKSESKKNY